MAFKSFKESTKSVSFGKQDDKELTLEEINTGAILRIADATEKMASNYTEMESNLEYFKDKCRRDAAKRASLERSNSSLKGHITRLKKVIKNNEILISNLKNQND